MRQLLQRAGIDTVSVASAGVYAIEGMSPTRETQRVLEEAGVDCSAHHARTVTLDLIQHADFIFVMEQFQADEVLRRAPSAKGKVHLLKPYGLSPDEVEGGSSIPDPIGKPMEIYEVCFAEIRDAVERLAKSLGVQRAEGR